MDSQQSAADVQDELVIRMMDGEDVFGEIVDLLTGKLFVAMQNRFPDLCEHDIEDVMANTYTYFWEHKDQFEGRCSLQTYLYKIAYNFALQLKQGHLKWQKQKVQELLMPVSEMPESACEDKNDQQIEEILDENSKLRDDVQYILSKLPPLQADILKAYASAGEYELSASRLGIDLGNKYENGVPIPEGTIRTYKSRAKAKVKSELSKRGHDVTQFE